MGGKASRDKGKRGEYLVRDYFRKINFVADRVPSSGASQGFKGDVKIKSNLTGEEYLIEVKSRKDSFKSIYDIYHQKKDEHGVFNFYHEKVCISVADSFLALKNNRNSLYPILEEPKRTLNKILNLQKLVKECHFLVIKDNNKPLLFLKFQ